MSIGAMSATSASQSGAWQQRKQDYSNMMAGAQAGDIGKAQTAYASLTANRTPPPNSPLAALGAAIQSGDTAAVQKAAQALQQARTGNAHRHHDADAAASQTANATAAASSSTTGVNILV